MSQALGLPGGVTVSIAADASEEQWHYSSLQNNTLLSSDAQGQPLGALTLYSPYGEVLTGHPPTMDGAPETGFDGANGVATETFAIDLTLMGDRVYIPSIHSFTTLDPTFNGGTSPYNYANADPINLDDPTGNATWDFKFWTADFWKVDNYGMWASIGILAFVAGLVIGAVVAFAGGTIGTAIAIGAVVGMIIGGGMAGASAYNSGYTPEDREFWGYVTLGMAIGGVAGGLGGGAGFTAAQKTMTAYRATMSTSRLSIASSSKHSLDRFSITRNDIMTILESLSMR